MKNIQKNRETACQNDEPEYVCHCYNYGNHIPVTMATKDISE